VLGARQAQNGQMIEAVGSEQAETTSRSGANRGEPGGKEQQVTWWHGKQSKAPYKIAAGEKGRERGCQRGTFCVRGACMSEAGAGVFVDGGWFGKAGRVRTSELALPRNTLSGGCWRVFSTHCGHGRKYVCVYGRKAAPVRGHVFA